jgi:soluble lytic murein transglycosylase
MNGKWMMDRRLGRRRNSHLASILIAAGVSLAAASAGAQQQPSVPTLRPADPSMIGAVPAGSSSRAGAETAALPTSPDLGASAVALPQPLDLADADRYRQAFDLQRAGQYRDAEVVIGWLSDHRLVGHVLAQRYLSPGYTASYRELATWLKLYPDHPEAPRLYALALKRRPAGAAKPQAPAVDLFQTGTADASSISADSRWRAGLSRWRARDLAGAAVAFESLAKTDQDSPWDRAAAAYWAARAHLKNREPAKVSVWLRMAAQYPRTFYGQLARRALGLDPSFDWSVKPLTPAGLRAVAASGVGQRMLALLQVNETALAEDEMRGLLRNASPDMSAGLLAIAQAYQLPSVALGLGVIAEQHPSIRADAELYPLIRWAPTGGYKVDRALLFALARQESGFNTRAQSGAGASGLMQIMPATAGALGARRADLHDPAVNLALGQEYLRRLLADPSVNGDLILMSIGYNAGPGTLQKWRSADRTADPLLFLESLPNQETRNFVERVMANYWIYQDRLGQDTPSLDRVAAGGWPTYQAQDDVATASGTSDGWTN